MCTNRQSLELRLHSSEAGKSIIYALRVCLTFKSDYYVLFGDQTKIYLMQSAKNDKNNNNKVKSRSPLIFRYACLKVKSNYRRCLLNLSKTEKTARMPQTKTESYSLLLCRNKGKGKSIRKRIRASFRRKSTRDKQKKLEQEKQELEELEAAREAAADIIVTTSEMKTPPATPGGILKKSGSGKGVSKKTAKVRKTSNFLTVEDGIRHLSLSGGSDTDNEL